MSELRTWIVRVSRFPLALPGEPLGMVRSSTYSHAYDLAAARFPRPFTIEPARAEKPALDEQIAKAVTSRAKRGGRGGYVQHHWTRRRPTRDLTEEN